MCLYQNVYRVWSQSFSPFLWPLLRTFLTSENSLKVICTNCRLAVSNEGEQSFRVPVVLTLSLAYLRITQQRWEAPAMTTYDSLSKSKPIRKFCCISNIVSYSFLRHYQVWIYKENQNNLSEKKMHRR